MSPAGTTATIDRAMPSAMSAPATSLKAMRPLKIKVGAASVAEDTRRVALVRRAIGDDAALMVDANGAYSLTEAEIAGRAFSLYNLAWFEEPLHWYDPVTALGKLASRLPVPIASGESEMHAWACRDLIDRGGVHFMQFDAARYGGVTEWLRVAAYADLSGVAMTTHHAPHIQGHLAAAARNGFSVETFPNAERDPVFANLYPIRAKLDRGRLILGDEPGFGFSINWDYLEKHRVQ